MIAAHTVQMIPLGRLRFGHEHPSGDVNVRRHKPGEAADLVASIAQEGVLQSLFTVPSGKKNDDALYVVAGGRRLTALHALREAGRLTDDTQVPAIVADNLDVASALAKSIAENDTHVPPHPVDRYEAFARIRDEGKVGPDDIAARFFIDVKIVNQALALAALSPKIREAWRTGEIRAEVAQAFTLGKNHKVQDALFKKLSGNGDDGGIDIQAFQVRRELGGNDDDASRMVEFIGLDAYRAAGGEVTEDLFEGRHVVADAGLAQSLAQTRLEQECQRLVGEGWAWAAIDETLPSNWPYSWQTLPKKLDPTPDEGKKLAELTRIAASGDDFDASDEHLAAGEQARFDHDRLEAEIRSRSLGAKDRAKAGCVVMIDDDGKLTTVYGVIRPKNVSDDKVERSGGAVSAAPEVKKAKAAASKKAEDPELSNALVMDLSVQLTDAAADALPADIDVALAAFIAGAAQKDYGGEAMQVELKGRRARATPQEKAGFATLFEAALKLTREKKLEWLARLAANAVELHGCNLADKAASRAAAGRKLVDALPAKPLLDALRKRWDAKDYFDRAPKAFALAALKEACGAGAHDSVAGHDAATIKKSATKNVPPTGWLPPELRPACYVAPKKEAANGAAKANGNGHAKPKPAAKAARSKAPAPKGKAKHEARARA